MHGNKQNIQAPFVGAFFFVLFMRITITISMESEKLNLNLFVIEKPTENQKLLKAIEKYLPKDVQTIIYQTTALLKMSDFLLYPITINKTEPVIQIASKKIKQQCFSMNQNNKCWHDYFCTDTENYSNQLLKTLSGYTQDYGAPAQLYEDKIVMCSKNGSIKIWSIPQGQLLHILTMDTTSIEEVLLLNNKLVTLYSNKTVKIWPLYIHFDDLEFKLNGESFIWKKDTITIPQADLIARMYDAFQANKEFLINIRSEDEKVFLSFDENVRLYLEEHLNIGFTSHPHNRRPYSRSICVMQ